MHTHQKLKFISAQNRIAGGSPFDRLLFHVTHVTMQPCNPRQSLAISTQVTLTDGIRLSLAQTPFRQTAKGRVNCSSRRDAEAMRKAIVGDEELGLAEFFSVPEVRHRNQSHKMISKRPQEF